MKECVAELRAPWLTRKTGRLESHAAPPTRQDHNPYAYATKIAFHEPNTLNMCPSLAPHRGRPLFQLDTLRRSQDVTRAPFSPSDELWSREGDMAREHRSKPVFPGGFDSLPSDSTRCSSHQKYTTEQLFTALVDQYNPFTGAELIVVKAAWYGKQTTSPRHEFILVQVEDRRNEDHHGETLVNYLVLDRNVDAKKHGKTGKTYQTSSQAGRPVDGFRVSYDGKIKQFLKDCDLNPHRWLGTLEFSSEEPLYLYKLVALAHVVSNLNPDYYATGSNCYMFAGVIWDNLRKLQPSATCHEPLLGERGRNGWYRYLVTESQVQDTYDRALREISRAESKIDDQKAHFDTFIQAQIAAAQEGFTTRTHV